MAIIIGFAKTNIQLRLKRTPNRFQTAQKRESTFFAFVRQLLKSWQTIFFPLFFGGGGCFLLSISKNLIAVISLVKYQFRKCPSIGALVLRCIFDTNPLCSRKVVVVHRVADIALFDTYSPSGREVS